MKKSILMLALTLAFGVATAQTGNISKTTNSTTKAKVVNNGDADGSVTSDPGIKINATDGQTLPTDVDKRINKKSGATTQAKSSKATVANEGNATMEPLSKINGTDGMTAPTDVNQRNNRGSAPSSGPVPGK